MKTHHRHLSLVASLFLALAAFATAQAAPASGPESTKPQTASAKGELVAVTEKDAAWVAEQKAHYPTNICVVSEDKLGEEGKPADFIYREAGKPDRLISFCCKDCAGDFRKDPDQYLKALDEAAAKKKG
jgi:hypothetical protein